VRATLGDTIFLVALTYGGAEDLRRSAAVGFNAHILKPAPVDHLASVIARRGAGSADIVRRSPYRWRSGSALWRASLREVPCKNL